MARKRILIQKGHHAPREPGFEGGTGASGEQETVDVLGDRLAEALREDSRFDVRVIPGQIPADVRSGVWRVDAFISLHTDGSRDPNRAGWGVGYPAGAVNRQLASLIAAEVAQFHRSSRLRDNYTTNMSGYYGYSRVPTPGPEVLVEHGFSSNPTERAWMVRNADRFAAAYVRALVAFFDLERDEPEREPAAPVKALWPVPIPAWFWVWARWYLGRGEFKELGPRHPLARPCEAPKTIPAWAWRRFDAILAAD